MHDSIRVCSSFRAVQNYAAFFHATDPFKAPAHSEHLSPTIAITASKDQHRHAHHVSPAATTHRSMLNARACSSSRPSKRWVVERIPHLFSLKIRDVASQGFRNQQFKRTKGGMDPVGSGACAANELRRKEKSGTSYVHANGG